MKKIRFDYYYGAEAEQFSFVRVPRVLFTDEYFADLSNDAKILYGFLLERMSLSRKNDWIDEKNRVYIVFPIEEVEELLGISHGKAVEILKELDEENGIGLVRKKRRGLGMPSILYVKNFITEKGSVDDDSKGFKNETSRSTENELQEVQKENFRSSKNELQEVQNLDGNYIYKNNIEKSYIESINQSETHEDGLIDESRRKAVEESVREQIDYDCLVSSDDETVRQMADEITELIVDVLCGERYVFVEGKKISMESAKSAFRRITCEHVRYVLQNIVNCSAKICRIDRYLTTSLYNSVCTMTTSTFAGFEKSTGIKIL